MSNKQFNEHDVEQFREKLAEQHRTEFLTRLRNEDDPSNERFQLIDVIGRSLERLKELEEMFLTEMLTDASDTICPTCLARNAVDLANVRTLCSLYNQYLSEGANVDH